MKVNLHTKSRRGDLIPVVVTLIVAVIGAAGIFNNLRPGKNSPDSVNARMVTAAAISRVGAIEIPSEPPAGRLQRGVLT
jgi:hypothetical protein